MRGGMGDFEVTVGTLQTLAGQLKSVGKTVTSARQGLDGLGKGQTGDGDLADAVHDFTDKWKYSLKKIGENAEQVGDKVGEAAKTYSDTDQAIANAAAGRS